MEEYEEAMKSYKSSAPTLLTDPRTQPLDLIDSAIAESSSSSPNITSPHHGEDVVHLPTLSNIMDNHQSILPKDQIHSSWKDPIIHS